MEKADISNQYIIPSRKPDQATPEVHALSDFTFHSHFHMGWFMSSITHNKHFCWSVAKLCPTFANQWTAAHQALPSSTISQSLLKFISIESVKLSNPLILCYPFFLLPAIFSSIRVFSNESVLHIKWPKFWSFNISPSNEYSVLIPFRIDWFDLLLSKGLSRTFSSTTVWKHQFFGAQSSLWSNSHICTWLLKKP